MLLGIACYLVPAYLSSLLPISSHALINIWWGSAFALCVSASIDAFFVRQLPPLKVERTAAGVWPVGRWQTVNLHIINEGQRALSVDVFDAYPSGWALQGMPYATTINGGHFAEMSYQLCPDQRGDALFSAAYIKVR
jgi:hypothetical protein